MHDDMYVTYNTFVKDEVLVERINTNCFSSLYSDEPWDRIELKIKTSEQTEDYKEFWLDLMKVIEPSLEFFSKEDDLWVNLPRDLKLEPEVSHAKVLFLLTAIRYLWESTNHYDDIVIMTYELLKDRPNTDPLTAILLANSCTAKCEGWGHSLVSNTVKNLKTVEDYQNNFNSTSVMGFTNSHGYFSRQSELREIRLEKKDKFDYKPVLKHYGLCENILSEVREVPDLI